MTGMAQPWGDSVHEDTTAKPERSEPRPTFNQTLPAAPHAR
jgi:hypothetical protein